MIQKQKWRSFQNASKCLKFSHIIECVWLIYKKEIGIDFDQILSEIENFEIL